MLELYPGYPRELVASFHVSLHVFPCPLLSVEVSPVVPARCMINKKMQGYCMLPINYKHGTYILSLPSTESSFLANDFENAIYVLVMLLFIAVIVDFDTFFNILSHVVLKQHT